MTLYQFQFFDFVYIYFIYFYYLLYTIPLERKPAHSAYIIYIQTHKTNAILQNYTTRNICTPLHILYIMYAYSYIDIHIMCMMIFIFLFFYFINFFLCFDMIFTNYAASVGRFCPPLNYIRQGRAPPDSSRCRLLSRAHRHSHSSRLVLPRSPPLHKFNVLSQSHTCAYRLLLPIIRSPVCSCIYGDTVRTNW